jgi:hypothetical protein
MDPRFPTPRMRDEFRSELRGKLLVEAQTALDPRRRRDNAWTSFLRPALGVGLAALVLAAGAGTAAAASVPGDAAFGLKRAVEDLQVTLTFDDVQRVQLLAQLADRRLTELEAVADRDDRAPTASEEYAAAIARFRLAVDAIQQAAPADKSTKVQDLVDAARDKHEAVIDEVQERVTSDEAKDALERAKEDDQKDTRQEQGDPTKTERPRTPEPTRTPRATATPRSSENSRDTARPSTPRPTPTFRASPTGDDHEDGR